MQVTDEGLRAAAEVIASPLIALQMWVFLMLLFKNMGGK